MRIIYAMKKGVLSRIRNIFFFQNPTRNINEKFKLILCLFLFTIFSIFFSVFNINKKYLKFNYSQFKILASNFNIFKTNPKN